MTYRSNTTLADLARRILAADRIMLASHIKPDGDAMGSMLALQRGLTTKGKAAHIYVMGPIEPSLIALAGPTPFRRVENDPPTAAGEEYDLIIITDTGAWAQLEPIADWLRQHHDRVVGIDHHTRGEDVASLRLIDPKAVSTTAILVALMDEMKVAITGEAGGIAEALFTGIATDSGWFRYENAGPEAFELAARLLRTGVNKSRLYEIIEETYSPPRLALEARALSSLEYARGGAAAIQTLRMEDFKETGAAPEDVTGLVNTPMSVGAVRVSVLITQTQPGVTKLSFRSKPAMERSAISDQRAEGSGQMSASAQNGARVPNASTTTAAQFINVNDLAAKFGGGGHIHAAGARVNMDIEEARTVVIDALNQA